MPGRTYCCNSPGYGTHLNSVVRSLKTAAGPSLDWAVKLLFFLAVLALYVWQMSSWDEIERQKCICTEVCVIEGIRITIANMDDSISVSICWYCFNILCMPQRVYCTPLIQITKQKAYMKACSWLSAPVDKDVELVYIMIGDSTRHVSTWRCVEKSLRSDVNDLRTWVPECALTPEHEVGPVSMVGDVMISRSRLLVRKSHFTNVYVSLDIIYNLSCISTSDFIFFWSSGASDECWEVFSYLTLQWSITQTAILSPLEAPGIRLTVEIPSTVQLRCEFNAAQILAAEFTQLRNCDNEQRRSAAC